MFRRAMLEKMELVGETNEKVFFVLSRAIIWIEITRVLEVTWLETSNKFYRFERKVSD